MTHVKIRDGVPEYYSIGMLRAEHKTVSFPENPADSILAEYDVYPLILTPQPECDPLTQNVVVGQPVLKRKKWYQSWVIVDATEEEKTERMLALASQKDALRLEAYRNEADPLFFKAQRGEATIEEWKLKVEEIKARYA